MPSLKEKEDSKKEQQEEKKKSKISDHVIAKLPPVDQIDTENKSKKKKQKGKDDSPVAELSRAPAAVPAIITAPASPQPAEQQPEAMVEMGGGLPALPPRPVALQRQAQASVSSAFSNGEISQRIPNVKQVSTPQFNIPAGSDLGAVGKIGAYQMAQIKPKNTSSATQIHVNMIFWVCVLLFVTMFIMKKQ